MIPIKLKLTIAKAITHRAIGSTISALKGNKIRQFGCVYDTRNIEITNQMKASLFWGLYEKAEASFVIKHLSGNYPVLELGGSLGVISCVIGKKIKNKKLVIVEANKSLLPIIERNLILNNINDYSVVCGGIGVAQQLYFLKGDNNTIGRITTEYESDSILVDEVDVGDLLMKNNIGTFSLVSDIEGAENIFLFDSPECLINCIEMIIELHETEFKGKYISFQEQIAQIEKLHFKIIDSHGPVIYARNEYPIHSTI